MTRRTRYLLIIIGFVVFLILAPLIVLYVRGVTYNFAKGSFVKTGIFAISAEPSDASVFFNGKLKLKRSGDLKFIAPGEYQIALQRQGYNTWSKRLSVQAGQVTWVSPANNKIYLLLSSPAVKTLGENVEDFTMRDGKLAVLTKDFFSPAASGDLSAQNGYALPKPVNTILASDGAFKQFVLVNVNSTASPPSIVMFNFDSGNFTDLTGLFSSLPKFQFSDSGDLFALNADTLYKVDPATKTTAAVLQKIKAFYFNDGDLYYISQTDNIFSLYLSRPPFGQSQLLLSGIPAFTRADLFVTFEKQIFLLADGNLYRANSTMEKVADSVTQSNFDPLFSSLAIFHSGEFDYYDGPGQKLNFVTRSGEPLKNPVVKNSIGYGFYLDSRGLNAIELDTRDSQNQYILYAGDKIQKFTIDNSGKNILLLDNGLLKSLTIR